MEEYPWFDRMNEALKLYYKICRRIHMVLISDNVPHKKRICDLKLMLINFQEDLLDAERRFLDQQFPLGPDKIEEAQEKFIAGPVFCSIILN
jgi:hypothetical protein